MLYQLYLKKKKKKNLLHGSHSSKFTHLTAGFNTTLESDSYYYLRTEKQRIRNFKNLLKIKPGVK